MLSDDICAVSICVRVSNDMSLIHGFIDTSVVVQ